MMIVRFCALKVSIDQPKMDNGGMIILLPLCILSGEFGVFMPV